MPAFTKQNYVMLAKLLHSVKPSQLTPGDVCEGLMDEQWERTCLALINHFKADNPAFDSERFLKACKEGK